MNSISPQRCASACIHPACTALDLNDCLAIFFGFRHECIPWHCPVRRWRRRATRSGGRGKGRRRAASRCAASAAPPWRPPPSTRTTPRPTACAPPASPAGAGCSFVAIRGCRPMAMTHDVPPACGMVLCPAVTRHRLNHAYLDPGGPTDPNMIPRQSQCPFTTTQAEGRRRCGLRRRERHSGRQRRAGRPPAAADPQAVPRLPYGAPFSAAPFSFSFSAMLSYPV